MAASCVYHYCITKKVSYRAPSPDSRKESWAVDVDVDGIYNLLTYRRAPRLSSPMVTHYIMGVCNYIVRLLRSRGFVTLQRLTATLKL